MHTTSRKGPALLHSVLVIAGFYVAGDVVLPENAVLIHRSVSSPMATFKVNAVNGNSVKLRGSLYGWVPISFSVNRPHWAYSVIESQCPCVCGSVPSGEQ